MPLINPDPNENKDDFVSRCMSNDKMKKEFPDNDQRLAVCNNIFESSLMEGKVHDLADIMKKVFNTNDN